MPVAVARLPSAPDLDGGEAALNSMSTQQLMQTVQFAHRHNQDRLQALRQRRLQMAGQPLSLEERLLKDPWITCEKKQQDEDDASTITQSMASVSSNYSRRSRRRQGRPSNSRSASMTDINVPRSSNRRSSRRKSSKQAPELRRMASMSTRTTLTVTTSDSNGVTAAPTTASIAPSRSSRRRRAVTKEPHSPTPTTPTVQTSSMSSPDQAKAALAGSVAKWMSKDAWHKRIRRKKEREDYDKIVQERDQALDRAKMLLRQVLEANNLVRQVSTDLQQAQDLNQAYARQLLEERAKMEDLKQQPTECIVVEASGARRHCFEV